MQQQAQPAGLDAPGLEHPAKRLCVSGNAAEDAAMEPEGQDPAEQPPAQPSLLPGSADGGQLAGAQCRQTEVEAATLQAAAAAQGSQQNGRQQGAQLQQESHGKVCCHCGTTASSNWRRDIFTGEPMCGRCRRHWEQHGCLPELDARCDSCGATHPWPGPAMGWKQGEATGGRRLCSPCFLEVRKQARLADEARRACHHCGTRETSHWRRQPDGSWRCSSCSGFASTHRGVLPPLDAPRCLECGSDSKGPGRGATWRFHPLTGRTWVCNTCFFLVKARSKLQRRALREGAGSASQGAGGMAGPSQQSVDTVEEVPQQDQQPQQQQGHSESRRPACARFCGARHPG
ncbi:hypothetical protein ABPG77_004217 [Micractinium sp. CCAP 211/92]